MVTNTTMTDILIGAIDQGTSSSRFLVYTKEAILSGEGPLCSANVEIILSYPHPGWVETDADVIYGSVVECIEKAGTQLESLGRSLSEIKCVGITNQRETTIVWNKQSGVTYGPAISWQDGRTRDFVAKFKVKEKSPEIKELLLDNGTIHDKTGLVMSEYSCCTKLAWMLENIDQLKNDMSNENQRGNIFFGTVDTWLIWKLTSGASFATDVSNASRTNFMSLYTLQWDPNIRTFFEIPDTVMFPTIQSNSDDFGTITAVKSLEGVAITGCMGDQHASLVGHNCFKVGESKQTYGTGLFLLTNIGPELKFSQKGVLTTIAYQFGSGEKPCFAMEGAIATGGSAVRWLRDNLGIIKSTSEVEVVASQVEDNGGVYFVPAFSGLFTPYWDSSARGVICGMTHNTNKHHIARAVLESLCYQTRDVLDTICEDSGLNLTELKADGGASLNNLLMQTQSDVLNMVVSRPESVELTALGAALAAAFGAKLISSLNEIKTSEKREVFMPKIDDAKRANMYNNWKKAVTKSQNWL